MHFDTVNCKPVWGCFHAVFQIIILKHTLYTPNLFCLYGNRYIWLCKHGNDNNNMHFPGIKDHENVFNRGFRGQETFSIIFMYYVFAIATHTHTHKLLSCIWTWARKNVAIHQISNRSPFSLHMKPFKNELLNEIGLKLNRGGVTANNLVHGHGPIGIQKQNTSYSYSCPWGIFKMTCVYIPAQDNKLNRGGSNEGSLQARNRLCLLLHKPQTRKEQALHSLFQKTDQDPETIMWSLDVLHRQVLCFAAAVLVVTTWPVINPPW